MRLAPCSELLLGGCGPGGLWLVVKRDTGRMVPTWRFCSIGLWVIFEGQHGEDEQTTNTPVVLSLRVLQLKLHPLIRRTSRMQCISGTKW